jgi:hypothetical protein
MNSPANKKLQRSFLYVVTQKCFLMYSALLLTLGFNGDASAQTGTPPTVAIAAPTNGAVFSAAGATVTVLISGSAGGTSGATLTKTELWDGGVLIGSGTGAAYNKPFALGAHHVEMRATDSRGQTASAYVDFTVVPAVAPTVTMTSPAEGATFAMAGNTFAVPVRGSAAAANQATIAKLEVLEGTTVLYTGANISSLTTTTVALPIGSHALHLRATDSLGLVAATESVNITLTGTPPTVAIVAPGNGALFSAAGTTATILISGTAGGTTGATIAKTELFDGATLIGSGTGAVYNKPFALGSHHVEMRATDTRGQTASAYVDFTVVPAVAPTVEMTSPSEGATFAMAGNTFAVPIRGSAAATNQATIAKLDVMEGTKVLYTGANVSSLTTTTVALPIGTHALQLRATDSLGLAAITDAVNITLTGTVPVAAISAPVNGASFSTAGTTATVLISGSANGTSGATIAKTELFDGATLIGSGTGAIYNKPFAIGAHHVELRATDTRGQTASAYTDFTVVAGAAPTATMITPVEGASYAIATGTTYAVPVSALATPAEPSTIAKLEILDGTVVKYTLSNASMFDTTVALAPGNHALQVRATDNIGKTGLSNVANVSVTVPPPTAKLTAPLDGAAYMATAAGTASFTVSGTGTALNGATISKVELLEDGLVLQSIAGATFSATRAFTVGVHAIQLRATDSTGQQGLSPVSKFTVFAQTTGNGAGFVSQTVPASMRAGQPYSVTVKMMNTGSVTWTDTTKFYLGSQNPQDTRTWTSTGRAKLAASIAPGAIATFTIPITAPQRAGTYNFQWRMVQEAVMWFGDTTQNLAIPVADGAGPTATLSVTPTNVRMADTPVTLTFAASGAEAGHKVTKLEVFLDSGAGFPVTAAKTATGTLASLSLNYAATATAGIYKYKARSTDELGVQTDSPIVLVNVSSNPALLGEVTGVRIGANNKPILFGWTCQGGEQPLTYQVLLDAPATAIGGTVLTSGIANLSTEANDSAARLACASPGTSHSFSVDLSEYSALYPGRAIYVRALAATGGTDMVLPCQENTCTIPGSLRIALAMPDDGQHYTGPATVFMKLQLSGGAGPYDEVSISVDSGPWAAANPDGALDAFSLSSSPLSARAAPYGIQARVRQGNTTLYSNSRTIYVDASTGTTVALTSPANGATATSGSQLNLSATTTGTAAVGVKFYANGQPIATGVASGNNWAGAWTNVPAGTYSVTASAFDGNGVLLAQSTAAAITVKAASGGSNNDTPVAIVVNVDQQSNGEGGALPGGVSVSNDGSAGYSMPVKLPPGILGMAPEISLAYDSNTPSGLAGLGWTLGGTAHIDRCGKIAATDGRSDGVRFSSYIGTPGVFGPYANQPADRLCLQGQRLILVNGNSANDADYWADGAIYRTEVETFTRVTAFVNNGKRAFKVEGKNGRTSYFGDTDDSYIEAQGRADGVAHRWYQSRTTDRSGNYISYSYNENTTTGEHNPASISWGGNTQHATVHFAKVEFGYEDRTDPRTSYIAGSQVSETKRLASIKTSVIASDDSTGAFATALTYTLAYETSPTSGRSLLHSVGACDGASHCLPATVFSWGKPDPSAQKAFVALGGVRTGPDLFALADNNPIGNKYVGTAMASIVAADFNGDGKTDILERYRVAANNFQQRLYTSDADGKGWTVSTPLAAVTGSATIIETGDFDGDGLPDLLVNEDSTGAWSLCLSSRRSGGNYACDLPVTGIPAAAFGTVPVGVPTRVVKDYNADGKDDLALRSDNSEQRRAFQCLSTGTDFNCIEVTQTADEPAFGDRQGETGTLLSTDVDGDGRVDSILLSKCLGVRQQRLRSRRRRPDGVRPRRAGCGLNLRLLVSVPEQEDADPVAVILRYAGQRPERGRLHGLGVRQRRPVDDHLRSKPRVLKRGLLRARRRQRRVPHAAGVEPRQRRQPRPPGDDAGRLRRRRHLRRAAAVERHLDRDQRQRLSGVPHRHRHKHRRRSAVPALRRVDRADVLQPARHSSGGRRQRSGL